MRPKKSALVALCWACGVQLLLIHLSAKAAPNSATQIRAMCQADLQPLNQLFQPFQIAMEIRQCIPISNHQILLWLELRQGEHYQSQLLWMNGVEGKVQETTKKSGWQAQNLSQESEKLIDSWYREVIFERDVRQLQLLPNQSSQSLFTENSPRYWWVSTEKKRAQDLLVQHHLLSFTPQGWQHKLTTRLSQRTQCDDQQACQWTELQWAYKRYGTYAYLYEQQQRQRWHETEQGKTRVETSQSVSLTELTE
ncbi:hypothetical protein VST7929_03122 [Vibrio stylophorae]|uniref:Uncharacterized protein n=1 Tax=Vibrio stylophorae TaxID=659351 RepID=A0ABN8DXT9_9VIBR|nr:hypothetical protein [Vibrio stylophorae]CAH0535574.1 hypothetical protein VST7929_03122 [Vibrio stylophorae]